MKTKTKNVNKYRYAHPMFGSQLCSAPVTFIISFHLEATGDR